VAAALVNVTNTAASPAISQGVERMASQNVYLTSNGAIPRASTHTLSQMFPDGTVSAFFTVPSGQSLVVTAVDIWANGGGTYYLDVAQSPFVYRKSFYAPFVGTTQFQYSSGIVFPAGVSLRIQNSLLSPGDVTMTMHGYLTSN
jgi:hypothetical protein